MVVCDLAVLHLGIKDGADLPGTGALDWHPLLDWRLSDVLSYLDEKNWPLHEAYTTYGCSRVSCIFCVLASRADLRAASTCEDNMDVYGKLVRLETDSTFAFQESHWLGDIAPLDPDLRDALACAKRGAQVREATEAGIPNHLLYEKGVPRAIPTWEEARRLREIRLEVAQAVRISVDFIEPGRIIERYQELMRQGNGKGRRRKHGTAH